MITIPLVLILFVLARRYGRHFTRIRFGLYAGGILVSVLAYLSIESPIFTMFRQGYLGLAFLYVVMLAGALPQRESQTRSSEQENPVRRDYAILAFLTFTPHAIYYLQESQGGAIAHPVYGMVAYLIMVPLFLTSFSRIRAWFSFPHWKALQRCAYLAYLALFIHLIVQSEGPNRIAYGILLVVYVGLKIVKTMRFLRQNPLQKTDR